MIVLHDMINAKIMWQYKKGLWILNMLHEMCVTTDQIIYWFQQVYHSYSETCQVFEFSQSLHG